MADKLQTLLDQIYACQLCAQKMRRPPRPVLQVSARARLLICGQAPGQRVFLSGKPFTDPSGDRLRDWLGLDESIFYDAEKVAIIPMGFCFPGYDDKGADLPPMKTCAEVWRASLLAHLKQVRLTLLIGRYAQKWHLGRRAEPTLTAALLKWRDFMKERLIVLPHPSWRNTAWLKRNPWFERDLLPVARQQVAASLDLSCG